MRSWFNNGVEKCAYLVFISALGDNFGSNLDLGFQESFQQISSIDTQQEGHPFSLYKYVPLILNMYKYLEDSKNIYIY